MQSKVYTFGIIIAVIVITGIIFNNRKSDIAKMNIQENEISEYSPIVNPVNFVSDINNKYFNLKPGMKFVYEKKDKENKERNEVVITSQNKQVMGVATVVVWDRVWLNDQLIEETYDWYAQDRDGNVWYFGEDVNNYDTGGELRDHNGAWEAGVDGAKPGIIMKANPVVGESYRQEYYKNRAEDMADVVSLNNRVTVPFGTFENCLKTHDWSRIDTATNEYKYYCPKVGFVVLEESGGNIVEKTELVSAISQ